MRTKLKKDEIIILVLKKHWIVILKPSIYILLFITLGMIFNSLESYTIRNIFGGIAFVLVLFAIYLIIARKYDIWIVTNCRVIDEHGIITHNSKESPIDKIHNLSFRQSLVGRLLDYGDVQIQTAAEMGVTTNKNVMSPKLLKETINKYQTKFKKDQDTDTKECPFCAERIKKKAIICRFCGKELNN